MNILKILDIIYDIKGEESYKLYFKNELVLNTFHWYFIFKNENYKIVITERKDISIQIKTANFNVAEKIASKLQAVFNDDTFIKIIDINEDKILYRKICKKNK